MAKFQETSRQKEAFDAWVGLGPNRSLTKLAGKGFATVGTLAKWRKKFDWDRKLSFRMAPDELKGLKPSAQAKIGLELLLNSRLLGPTCPVTEEEVRDRLKLEFIKAYHAGCCTASLACEACNVSYSVFQDWMKGDPEFSLAIDMVKKARVDYVVARLMQKIEEGSSSDIQFFLRNQDPENWNEKRFDKSANPNAFFLQQNNYGAQPGQDLLDQPADEQQYFGQVLDILQTAGVLEAPNDASGDTEPGCNEGERAQSA